ncbi:MAG: phosphotransferase [Acidobacteriia bacterium]|nr:phosphotransferase [Methyloceanibacter sp.]MCL6492595.1 phosphotransferase [Terriglobia bacterium]
MKNKSRLADFLAAYGFADAELVPLASDASARRYFRLLGGPRPAVLMDTAAEIAQAEPFLRIAEHLARLGLSAPAVLGADAAAGLILLEDFGDLLLARLIDAADASAQSQTEAMFDTATDALICLHEAPPPPALPHWDGNAMQQAAAATFLEWWWPAAFGSPPEASIRSAFDRAMAEMLLPLQAGPKGFVHRDYFANNLFWLPEREGVRRIGIIDFQDAAIGHPAYDLVSLLEDARREIPKALKEREIARYLGRRTSLDASAFRHAYAVCAAQRHLRVAALWVRLAKRDGRAQYSVHGPRTWRLLAEALEHPATAPLARFLDRFVPPSLRANPMSIAA